MFDDDQQPLGVLCFQDCDTIQSRGPFLPLIDVVARCKGGDTRLISKIRHLTQVKLDTDAKHFLSQDVQETTDIGIRWEQPAIPMSLEEFKTQMHTQLNPESIPGISVHSMADHTNSLKKTILVKDESVKPRVILWHEQRLSLTETKFRSHTTVGTAEGQRNLESRAAEYDDDVFVRFAELWRSPSESQGS
jgi:hypothetical protein